MGWDGMGQDGVNSIKSKTTILKGKRLGLAFSFA